MSKGAAFNILSGAIDSKSPLSRRNLLIEFGEFFPGYKRKQRSTRGNVPMTMHEEPKFLELPATFESPFGKETK